MKNISTKEDLYKKIDNDDEFATGCLMLLYGFQTEDERADQKTTYNNNAGFSGVDARFMSSVAQFYLKTKNITPGQIAPVKRNLKKYHRQLLEFGYKIQPCPLKRRPTRTAPLTDVSASVELGE